MDYGDMSTDQKVEEGMRLLRRLGISDELESIRELTNLAELVHGMIFDEVRAVIEDWDPPASWSAVGEALGVSRQTAWDRWHGSVQEPPKARKRAASSNDGPQWWKLNLHSDHVAACEAALVFGTNKMPAGMRPGDVLLLQANLSSRPDPKARIRSALVYETVRPSHPGEGRDLWGQDFKYMIVASECLQTKPFSLELLDLAGVYRQQGQMANQRVLLEDVPAVRRASGLN